MLVLQEVIVTGVYRLDSRGAERRWLPPTLPNCENSLSWKHSYYLQHSSMNVSHVTCSNTVSSSLSVLTSANTMSPEHQEAFSSLYLNYSFSDKAANINIWGLIFITIII